MSRTTEGRAGRGSFLEALCRARSDRGLSQVEVARLLRQKFGEGVQSTVSDWEGGTKEPDPDQLFELERIYGVKPGSLSSRLGYVPLETLAFTNTEQAIIADPHLPEVEKKMLVRAYRLALEEPLA